jgi:hypothetical protein
LGCHPEWEPREGDCSTAAGDGGYQSRQAGGGEARGAAVGRHGDVVNTIRGQRGGVAHQGGCSMAVGGRPEGNGGRGGVGRRLTVREGGTRRLYGELRGGPGAALHVGSMAAEQDGALGAIGERKKGCSRGGWAPFIASRGGGRRRRGGESEGGETTAGNQRSRRCHGSVRLPVVYVSGQQLSGRWARAILTGCAGTVDMGWVQSGAQHFSNYSSAPILKYKTKTILMSINVQAWHGARVDYSKLLHPLDLLPIPNRIPVIKFGTNSTLNF